MWDPGIRWQSRHDLHYAGSIRDYIGRRKAGMDVRIVKNCDWHIDTRDMEKVVDKTRLISITLVSNVNGWVEDAKSSANSPTPAAPISTPTSSRPPAACPVDVKALGIDFAACSNYKWLHGARGAG